MADQNAESAFWQNIVAPPGMQQKAQELIRKYNMLKQELDMWTPTWQELTEFMMPRKANVQLTRSPGQTQTERLMDSTAVHANVLLAASMQASLTSASVRWFYYRIRGLAPGIIPRVDQWLETAGEATYDELRKANFSSESHEFYADLGCVGTAAMFIDEKKKVPGQKFGGLRFLTMQPGTYVIDENEEGFVDTLMYRFELSARQAAMQFTKVKLPPTIIRHLEEGKNEDQKIWFYHMVYPRRAPGVGENVNLSIPKDRPWASVWVSETENWIVKEGGYHEFPFAVARWTKASGEKYGRSPGYTALPDVKTLNKLVELKLRALAVMVQPPVKVRDDGVLSQVRLFPGGQTHVRDMDAVETLKIEGRLDVAGMEEGKIQGSIRRTFFSDQLQLQEGPQMTATEVNVRYELMQRVLGPTLGRLEHEFLAPLINRVFNILNRNHMLPEPPPELQKYYKEGGSHEIEYEGPLQRAQRLSDIAAIQRFTQMVIPLAQVDMGILDIVNLDEVARVVAKAAGVPASMIRSQDEIDAKREERAQQQAQQAQMQQAESMSKSAGQAAPLMEALTKATQAGIIPPSTMQGVTGAAGG